jgi:hypothetical protein
MKQQKGFPRASDSGGSAQPYIMQLKSYNGYAVNQSWSVPGWPIWL